MSEPSFSENIGAEPPYDCPLCPRLRAFVLEQRRLHPEWHNGPVPSFLPGPNERHEFKAENVRLLIVGLAPGLRGANRTGRPFTGDFAGDLLYATLAEYGFANECFDARTDDGLALNSTIITNAVRCVPPQNKPVGAEIATCRQFLSATISSLPALKAIVTLGVIAHQSTVRSLGLRVAEYKFRHGAQIMTPDVTLFPSYHCSRYNTNTGRLTPDMFRAVFADVREYLSGIDQHA